MLIVQRNHREMSEPKKNSGMDMKYSNKIAQTFFIKAI